MLITIYGGGVGWSLWDPSWYTKGKQKKFQTTHRYLVEL